MYQYVVGKNELTSRSVILLTLTPASNADIFAYRAGQYVTVGWQHGAQPTPVRCFSLVSSPTQRDFVQLAMRVQGDFTAAAATLKVGAKLKLRGPFGDFTLRPDAGSQVMVAGGIGITPMISMIRYATDSGLGQPLTLLYSCRTQDDVSFLPELDELSGRNPLLTVVYAITSGSVDKLAGRRVQLGRIDQLLLKPAGARRPAGPDYYLCGPPAFITAMADNLRLLGVADDHVHAESFSQGKDKDQTAVYGVIFGLTGLAIVGGVGLLSFKQIAQGLVGNSPAVTASPITQTVAPGSDGATSPTATPYQPPTTSVS